MTKSLRDLENILTRIFKKKTTRQTKVNKSCNMYNRYTNSAYEKNFI